MRSATRFCRSRDLLRRELGLVDRRSEVGHQFWPASQRVPVDDRALDPDVSMLVRPDRRRRRPTVKRAPPGRRLGGRLVRRLRVGAAYRRLASQPAIVARPRLVQHLATPAVAQVRQHADRLHLSAPNWRRRRRRYNFRFRHVTIRVCFRSELHVFFHVDLISLQVEARKP